MTAATTPDPADVARLVAGERSFRDSVYRDSLAAGYPADLARLIADGCGVSKPAAAVALVLRLCAVYDARGLARDFLRLGLPVAHVAAFLDEAAGTSRTVSAAGAERIRVQLFAGGFR